MSHVSSGSFQAWRTPRALARALVDEFDIRIDAAADSDNTVCEAYFDGSDGMNGLQEEWSTGGGVWINPPYDQTGLWLSKAIREVATGRCARAVMLVPAAVGVEWFQTALDAAQVHIFDRRIRFDPPPPEDLDDYWISKLYRVDSTGAAKPKTSPGGGNALLRIEPFAVTGITGLRSAETGAIIRSWGSK